MGNKAIYNINPIELLGENIVIYLKEGGVFLFRVTEAGVGYIRGYDDERQNLHINIKDIEFVKGVGNDGERNKTHKHSFGKRDFPALYK